MANPGPSLAAPLSLHCDHCGRVVHETRHTRTSYQVDYYSMHTGDAELASLATEDETRRVTFRKLLTAVNIVTCADCYRVPAVQNEREHRFRPELARPLEAVVLRE